MYYCVECGERLHKRCASHGIFACSLDSNAYCINNGSPICQDQILSQTGIEPVILNGIEKQIAAQGQKATGDFDMANILLQQSGAYDTISAQLTNAIMTGLSFL